MKWIEGLGCFEYWLMRMEGSCLEARVCYISPVSDLLVAKARTRKGEILIEYETSLRIQVH